MFSEKDAVIFFTTRLFTRDVFRRFSASVPLFKAPDAVFSRPGMRAVSAQGAGMEPGESVFSCRAGTSVFLPVTWRKAVFFVRRYVLLRYARVSGVCRRRFPLPEGVDAVPARR